MKAKPSIDYLKLKTDLSEKFGDTLFTIMKKDVQDLLLVNSHKPKIMNAVRELHSQGVTSYLRIKNDIAKKFSPRLLGMFKEEIRILLRELSDEGATNSVKRRRRSSLRRLELRNRFADEDGAVWEFLYVVFSSCQSFSNTLECKLEYYETLNLHFVRSRTQVRKRDASSTLYTSRQIETAKS